jgi:hypothetical protein
MGAPEGPDAVPKGLQWTGKAPMGPLMVHGGPLFSGSLGVEVGPLPSLLRVPRFSFLLPFFNTPIRPCSVLLVSLGPPGTEYDPFFSP